MDGRELTQVERELRGYLSAQLDQVPVRSAPNFSASLRRRPLALRVSMATLAVALGLVLAIGAGQGVRGLRERVAASQSPDAVSSTGASSIVPPNLASPDSIVALSESNRGLRTDAPAIDARIQVIDSQTGAIRYSVPVANQAQAVFRAAGSELIVIDWPSDTEQRIRFVDARTGTVTSTLTESRARPSLGQWPALGAAVSPDGKLLALQQLGTPGQAPAQERQGGQADVLTYYNLETRSHTADGVVFTPGCGPGQAGFTDDGRNLFLVCSTSEFYVIESGTRKAVAGALPPRRGTSPGVGGVVVVGNSATVVTSDGKDRYVIRLSGSVSSVNLGQMFGDSVVPTGAIVRVPRQARVFVGYGPATPGGVVNDARIMDEGSSGGRFSITRESVGGLLADDRGNLFGAAADGSIWRRGSTTVSDDVTLVSGTPGRTVRLLSILRVSAPTILSRDQAIKFVNAPNIRIDRIDRVEAKLVTLGEIVAAMQSQQGVLNGFDPATPVWAIAVRGEMHAIRGLVDVGPGSALFFLDAQTGQFVIWYSSPLAWPAGFDALVDRAPATPSPSVPVSGATPIGDNAARSACDGKLGSARLVAAFESTAGVVADWVENTVYPDAPHVASSEWRRLAPTAPAYVCYFDGQFATPGGPYSPGASVPPLVGRALILIDSSGTQRGPSKYGPSDSIPVAPPGGRF